VDTGVELLTKKCGHSRLTHKSMYLQKSQNSLLKAIKYCQKCLLILKAL
jgi:hypothetical protein